MVQDLFWLVWMAYTGQTHPRCGRQFGWVQEAVFDPNSVPGVYKIGQTDQNLV